MLSKLCCIEFVIQVFVITHCDKRFRWENKTNSLQTDYKYLTWLTVKSVLTYLWRQCTQNTQGGGIADQHTRPAGGCWDYCVPGPASEGCSLLTLGYSGSWVISPAARVQETPDLCTSCLWRSYRLRWLTEATKSSMNIHELKNVTCNKFIH